MDMVVLGIDLDKILAAWRVWMRPVGLCCVAGCGATGLRGSSAAWRISRAGNPHPRTTMVLALAALPAGQRTRCVVPRARGRAGGAHPADRHRRSIRFS